MGTVRDAVAKNRLASLMVVASILTTGVAKAEEVEPLIKVEAETSRVKVELDPPEASLLRRASVATATSGEHRVTVKGYAELCSGSCTLKLAAGSYSFALSPDGEKVSETSRLTLPPGDSQLVARYTSHAGPRTFGWVLVATSPLTWWGSLIAMKATNTNGDAVSGKQLAVGTGIGLAQLAIGIVLVVLNQDTATFTLTPDAK
jgi:hypothetical protein